MIANVPSRHCPNCGAFLPRKPGGLEPRPTRMEYRPEPGEEEPQPFPTRYEQVEVWVCSRCGETWSLKELLGGLDWLPL